MIRIIVGTLVEVGLGRRQPGEIPAMLAAKNRAAAGATAPPQGLYLHWIIAQAGPASASVEPPALE